MKCFTAFDSEMELVGFTAVTSNISRISWIEPRFYSNNCADACRQGRFYYFPYIFVHPEAQSGGVVRQLFDKVIEELAPERAVVGFDVSEVNMKLVFAFRAAMVRAFGAESVQRLDTHSFYIAPLDGSAVELLNRTPDTVEPR